MTRYARIEAGVVAEFISTDRDIGTLFPPSLQWLACDDQQVSEGWGYADGTFTAPPPPPDQRPDVWSLFRVRRDGYLARLGEIAGRFSRQGNTVIPSAADAIAQGLLDMPSSPVLQALPDARSLSDGIVIAANQLLRAQLTDPATAPAIKAALDQVFKQP